MSILPKSLHFVHIYHRNLIIPRNTGGSQRFQHHLPTRSIYTYKDNGHTFKGKNNGERFGFIWWEKAVAIFLACVHYVKLKLFNQSLMKQEKIIHTSNSTGPCVITLDMIFGVTYYWKLHNCHIYLLYVSYFTNKCEIGSLDITKH